MKIHTPFLDTPLLKLRHDKSLTYTLLFCTFIQGLIANNKPINPFFKHYPSHILLETIYIQNLKLNKLVIFMVKKKKRNKGQTPPQKKRGEQQSRVKQHGLAFLLISVLLSLYFSPMLFQNKGPQATDTIASRAASKHISEYNKTHQDEDIALWNPNIFSGMQWVFGKVNRRPWWSKSIHD
ncbi:hypothetical protein IIA28_18885, partial [candidate division KSB1 bacterium]|nr:hypothetical protein [candidate division KSB1 bacterium]